MPLTFWRAYLDLGSPAKKCVVVKLRPGLYAGYSLRFGQAVIQLSLSLLSNFHYFPLLLLLALISQMPC